MVQLFTITKILMKMLSIGFKQVAQMESGNSNFMQPKCANKVKRENQQTSISQVQL